MMKNRWSKYGYCASYYYDQYSNNNIKNNCNIDKIYLINYNLTGIVLSSISNIFKLNHLRLNENNLFCEIPKEIATLI
jgi:hypothetical protein